MVRAQKLRSFLPVVGMTLGFVIVFDAFHPLLQRDDVHQRINNFRSKRVIGNSIGIDDPPSREDFDENYVQENLNSLDQADPRLIQFAKVRYLTPPSKLPYNKPNFEGYRTKHVQWVEDFFGSKRNGTFIEAGVNNGEGSSHTYYLEKQLGWTGLLVECNPLVTPYLKTAHRKAWVGTVCLALTKTPGTLKFNIPKDWAYSGRLGEPWKLKVGNDLTPWSSFDVETVPLYTLLAAIGLKEIDFFLFDVEGAELSVLKTFPFDEIIFKVLMVEIFFYTTEEKEELNTLLVSNEYYYVTNVTDVDLVYIHNSVKNLLKEEVSLK